MRPHALRLTAFGSYPGTEHVDFDALARLGLFTVTGPTGAGKTTIFDAMAFALYGGVPGDRPTAEVRSHHAGPSERCSVELTFSVEGTTYRVARSPEQERPKRRGAGTVVEPATAELHRLDPDGRVTPVASGTRQVTDACTALVGLDAGQFERVVLLPQGKFQQFLLAGTKERRPLLQKLFGTGLYRDAVEELKRRAAELRRQVERVDTEIDHHRLNAKDHLRTVAAGLADDELDGVEPDDDIELLEGFWQKLAPGVAEAERNAAELGVRAAEATRAAQSARSVAEQWARRAELVARAEVLAKAGPDIQAARERVAAARRAAPVVAAADVLDLTRRGLAAAELAVERSTAALAEQLVGLGLAEPGEPVDPAGADTALGQATAELVRSVEQVKALAAAVTEHQAAAARVERLGRDTARHASEVEAVDRQRTALVARRTALEPLAAGAAVLAERVEASATRVEQRRTLEKARRVLERQEAARHEAESALAHVLADFVAGAAPRLAATLRAGESCPVCGSVEHPQPARSDLDGTVDVAVLEKAQRAAAKAASDLADTTSAVRTLAEGLGPDADRPLDELLGAHRALLVDANEADAAATELAEVRTASAAADTRHAALVTAGAELAASLAAAEATAVAAAEKAAELRAEVGDLDPEALARRGPALAAAADAVEACRTALAAATAAAGALDQASTGLTEALAASGLPDLDAARASALPDTELGLLDQRVAAHDHAVAEVRGGLDTLAEVELPVDRPDVDALERTAAELRRIDELERARVERLLERGALAQKAIAEARRVEDTNTGLRDLRERAERVANLCDGQGPGRISLETWVLAGELDRVTDAANVHLARMTNGRYQLRRTDDAGHKAKQAGLDLSVLDSHTGRARPPATLSGGEQFQASLALALGLADVVSLGGVGSGRRFEALFVDEGFGSLDPSALDQAVDALHQIHSSGRMVGVITHVDAMKQQLPTGIDVQPRPDGRGSTVVQVA
jgi:exonuclease SbcC